MDYTILLDIGIIIAAGLLSGKLAKLLHLPNATGYLIGGLLIGPSLLNLINEDLFASLEVFSVVALGFIAFSIGNEMKISYFKRVGTKPILIAFFEATMAVVFVFVALIIFFAFKGQLTNINIRFSLVLASIAAATAPAATLLVIRQYKAKGKLSEMLMTVVAIDDSVAVLLFGIGVAITNAVNPNIEHASVLLQVLQPIFEILISLGVGGIIGIILVLGTKWFTGRGNRISLAITMVLVTIFLSDYLGGSYILACMTVGAIFANFSNKYEEVNGLIYFVTPPIYILFFVFSGVEIDMTVLLQVGAIGLVYIVARMLGKVVGASTGSRLTKQEPNIIKYLGFSLMPQAGVAIGLSLIASHVLSAELGSQIKAIILASSVIYGIIGPIVTKYTLEKAGEITVRG
jgi:Kef-type K+ transport system membrane component KefB